MSKHETWRTLEFWKTVGGLLIEEFLLVKRGEQQAQRLVDGVIVFGEKDGIHKGNTFDLTGRDIICIQTKSGRLGMNLLGQAYFSRKLLEQQHPKSIRSIAICGKTDAVMEVLARAHGVEVVVIP